MQATYGKCQTSYGGGWLPRRKVFPSAVDVIFLANLNGYGYLMQMDQDKIYLQLYNYSVHNLHYSITVLMFWLRCHVWVYRIQKSSASVVCILMALGEMMRAIITIKNVRYKAAAHRVLVQVPDGL